MAKGIIKRYDFRKGFGFIVDDQSGDDLFFHKSAWQGDGPIRQGLAVNYVEKDSDKGPQAESVVPLESDNANSSKPGKKAEVKTEAKPKVKPKVKPASPLTLEDRVASLEDSVGIWKVLSLVALAGVVVLGIDRFIL